MNVRTHGQLAVMTMGIGLAGCSFRLSTVGIIAFPFKLASAAGTK